MPEAAELLQSVSHIAQGLFWAVNADRDPHTVVGDIHGDLRKAISSLEAARVLQEVGGQVRWAGGDTVVVQLGDVLDRGDSEIGQMYCEPIDAVLPRLALA